MGVYDKYKKRYSLNSFDDRFRSGLNMLTVGEEVKISSDMVMNETWWNDPQSQVAYLYDWYHDENKTEFKGLEPKYDHRKTPIDIKFIKSTYQSLDKDIVTRHIMLRPYQKCNVEYYKEFFDDRYDAKFPVGLYIDIADFDGKYNRWLVVRVADYYDGQFPKFEVLPCDKILQYVYDGIKYNIACVSRSQNSYKCVALYRNV